MTCEVKNKVQIKNVYSLEDTIQTIKCQTSMGEKTCIWKAYIW